MADFYARRDVQSITAFSDPDAFYEFKFEAYEQLVINESDTIVEVSFDGINVHARMLPSGPTSAINWTAHIRMKMWVRRAVGVGGGTKFVQVIANTR